MSKLTFTHDNVVEYIKNLSGVKITYEINDWDGVIYYNNNMGVQTKITTTDWMEFQNRESGDGIATKEFMDMNLLYCWFVIVRLGMYDICFNNKE